jgi:peptide/nickel transport system substrate-binding protein
MKHNRWFQLFTIVIAATMILTACATSTPTAAPTTQPVTTEAPTQGAAPTTAATEAPTTAPAKSTVIIGVTDSIASLDPADAYATRDWEEIKNISRTLVRWAPGELKLQPDLATDMGTISSDGLTYTFTLVDGVKFGDGTPLDATLYAAQLNRLLTIGPTCPNDVADSLVVPFVDSITAPDAKTIVFTLKQPTAFFIQLLATAPYVPTDPNTFTADACNLFPTAPIYGVGPWYISQFTPKEQIVFDPNPYYNGDLVPQSDEIIVRYYNDPNTMALAVQNGEIDIAWRFLSSEQITALKNISDLHVETINGGGIRYLIMNHTMAPTDDPNVDKAIASAIDRNAIADTVYQGTVQPLYSMLPPGFLGADTSFDTIYAAPNIDEAKKYLEASGYSASNPLIMDLWYPPEHYGASTAAVMELIKSQLEATGEMQINLQSQEWSTYVTNLTGGQSYACGFLGWFFDYPDSSNYLDPFVYNKGEGTNITVPESGSAYGVPITGTFEADATQLVSLLNQADSSSDQNERATLYQQAQQIYADMVVTIPLFFVAEHVTYRSNIQGNPNFASPQTLNIGPNIEFWYSVISKTP